MRGCVFLFLLFTQPVLAGDLRLNINIASKHFTKAPLNLSGYNEHNPGLGLELQVAGKYYVHGGYIDKNSHNEPGRYLGIGRKIYEYQYASIGAEYTKADGYHKDYSVDPNAIMTPTQHAQAIQEFKEKQNNNDDRRGFCLYSAFKVIKDSGPKILYCGRLAALQYQLGF